MASGGIGFSLEVALGFAGAKVGAEAMFERVKEPRSGKCAHGGPLFSGRAASREGHGNMLTYYV